MTDMLLKNAGSLPSQHFLDTFYGSWIVTLLLLVAGANVVKAKAGNNVSIMSPECNVSRLGVFAHPISANLSMPAVQRLIQMKVSE